MVKLWQNTTQSRGLPPRGGSGLKFQAGICGRKTARSPSTRREWIEMQINEELRRMQRGLPPRGGSGLKSVPMSDSAPVLRLPPRGGSGLKFFQS